MKRSLWDLKLIQKWSYKQYLFWENHVLDIKGEWMGVKAI